MSMTVQLDSLKDVLVEQVGDLQSAEQQLISALPKMAGAASNDDLRQAFETHLEQTRNHAERLIRVAGMLGTAPPSEECQAMKGLIAEGDDVIRATGDPDAKDAALIAAAQRVEHYEIAAYGTARTLSEQLGLKDAASLLEETLNEESNADKRLTKIATGGMLSSGINKRAAV
jgi:ferritin-like metal-binding protein YciE